MCLARLTLILMVGIARTTSTFPSLSFQVPCDFNGVLYYHKLDEADVWHHGFVRKFAVDGVSVPEVERESYAWLEEREQPEDLAAVGALYKGPKIVENRWTLQTNLLHSIQCCHRLLSFLCSIESLFTFYFQKKKREKKEKQKKLLLLIFLLCGTWIRYFPPPPPFLLCLIIFCMYIVKLERDK